MLKTFVLLFCLSVTLGVGYSASNKTTTATPTASNASTTAKTATPTKPTATTNSTTKSTSSTSSTTKPTSNTSSTTKPTSNSSSTAKPTSNTSSTATPTSNTSSTATPTSNTSSTATPTSNTSSTATPTSNTSSTAAPTSQSTTQRTTTAPPYGTFSLKRTGKNTTEYCLLAQFAVTFTVNYLANVSNGNSSKLVEKTGMFSLDGTSNHNVMINGDCGSDNADAMLVLTWPKKEPYYSLTMVFSMTNGLEATANRKWGLQKITLNVTLEGNQEFKNATETYFTSMFNGSSGSYDVGTFYSCYSKDDERKFETTTANYTVHAVFEDVRLEPFVNKTADNAFDKDKYTCPLDNHPKPTPKPANNDIVPIAVGCALAGLVLIVLIAYIIGRRKSHRGYEKV